MRWCVQLLSYVQLFATPWTVACQPPLAMGFSRQEYWSGLTFPSPEDLPDPEIKPRCPALQADSLPSEPPGHSSIYHLSVSICLSLCLSIYPWRKWKIVKKKTQEFPDSPGLGGQSHS